MNIPKSAESAIKFITDMCSSYEERIDALKKENEFFKNFSPPEKLFPYRVSEPGNNPDSIYWDAFKPIHLESSSWNSNNIPNFIRDNWTVEKIKNLLKDDEAISIKNKEIAARNEERYKKVIEFLKRIGLSDHKYVRKSSRSINTVKVGAEWVSEVSAMYPRSDRWSSIKHSYENAIKKIEEYNAEKQKHLNAIKQASDAEQKKHSKLVCFIQLNLKYKLGVADPCGYYAINQGLMEKDKYLYLAHYLLANRNDWSEGYDYAENGISFFDKAKNENFNDELISSDIHARINDWGGDGRTFRDSPFGYDYLFGLVGERNPELYTDYLKLQEYKE